MFGVRCLELATLVCCLSYWLWAASSGIGILFSRQFSCLELFISQIGIVGHNYRSQKFFEIKRRIWGGIGSGPYSHTIFGNIYFMGLEVPGKFTLFLKKSYVWLLLFSRREFEKIE